MGYSKQVLSGAVLAAAFALSAVVVPVATAAGSSSATGGGTAEEGGGLSTFVFNAVQTGKGVVTGHLVYHVRAWPITIMVDLDCLKVDGNVATMSGVVSKVSEEIPDFIFVGQDALFRVTDNGQGADAAPDLISDLWLWPENSCITGAATGSGVPAGTFPAPYIPIRGNIQVR